MRGLTISLAAAVALTGALAVGASVANGANSATVRPCTSKDVSIYYGGFFAGMGQRSFDLTLLAHDGITCTLSDTPKITLGGPPDQKLPILVHVMGRGGTLTLRPDSPLHATLNWNVPDESNDGVEVNSLTLAMPDGSTQNGDFGYPGNQPVYDAGVYISAWTTGIGLGEGEQP